MPDRLRVGILGCGMIAFAGYGYLPGMTHLTDKVELVAACDPITARAEKVVRDFGARRAYADYEELLADPEVDAIINLSPIPAHDETNLKALLAGKHVVTEKPIATDLDAGLKIVKTAEERSLRVVCAPPDPLQPTIQHARRLIEEGSIGKVCFARAHSSHGGPAAVPFWPVDPTWFYKAGSGPLYDMGVYGITQLTAVLGPAKRVFAFSGITEPTRVVAGGPARGKVIEVEVDDNTLLMLDFGGSTFAVVDGTYNLMAAKGPWIEFYGRTGTLNVNNPMWTPAEPLFEVMRTDPKFGPPQWCSPGLAEVAQAEARAAALQRAVVVEDLVNSVLGDRAPVLSGERGVHVLEIMLKAYESAREGRAVDLQTSF